MPYSVSARRQQSQVAVARRLVAIGVPCSTAVEAASKIPWRLCKIILLEAHQPETIERGLQMVLRRKKSRG